MDVRHWFLLFVVLRVATPLTFASDGEILALFERTCAACHSNGDEMPDLNGGINLERLRSSEDDVKTIVDRITRADSAKGRMPKSKGEPGSPSYLAALTKPEIDLITQWALGKLPSSPASDPKPPVLLTVNKAPAAQARPVPEENPGPEPHPVQESARTFLSLVDEVRLIAADLEAQPSTTRPFLRYLTLTNLANLRTSDGQPIESDLQLNNHRAALSKLLNSLSHEGQIHVPQPIDTGKLVYRFDLRHYGWTREEWEIHVVRHYPYALRGFDARREEDIAEATKSQSAWVRGDWFVFTASQPPLYNQLLRLPANDRDLERHLGVNVLENLQQGRALRAGFRESGVSQGNRMIERHELGRYPGAYWKSYDFSPLVRKGGHDLFRSPLGPVGAGLTENKDREFAHDGGEIIWNLPNGLQAYYLSTAAGDKLDRAPTEIVQDRKRRDGAIINGISCIACHDAGMKYTLDKPIQEFRDEVGPIAIKAGLDRAEARAVADLYASQDKLHAVVTGDEERFKKALTLAMPGYDQPLDPVGRLYNRFKADVTLETLAAEFGEKGVDFLQRLKETRDADLESIATQLEAGMGFPRSSFLDQFESVVRALRYQQLQYTRLSYTEFNSDAPRSSANQGQVALSGGGKLILSTDKARYVDGELLKVRLKLTEGAFVRLFHLSADKKVTQVFPNAGQPDNFVRGGKEIILPGPSDKFRFRMGKPFGTEIILAVASPVQFQDRENLQFARQEVFKQFKEAELLSASRRGTKGLTVEVTDSTGKVTGERTAPTFTARAVYSVGPR